MERSTNALAELAEDLGNTDEGPSPESICKAQRIVAELAKLKWWNYPTISVPKLDHLADVVINCRAIAEEGAEDGK